MSQKIIAPMPGRIISVEVAKGQEVEADSLILVLEAMKMHNEIFCDAGGKVAELLVSEGQTVNVNDVMVVIE